VKTDEAKYLNEDDAILHFFLYISLLELERTACNMLRRERKVSIDQIIQTFLRKKLSPSFFG